MHERATPLCRCGTEENGLGGPLVSVMLAAGLDDLKVLFQPKWSGSQEIKRNPSPYQPDSITSLWLRVGL